MSAIVGWGNTDKQIIENLVKEVEKLKSFQSELLDEIKAIKKTLQENNNHAMEIQMNQDGLAQNDIALKQMIDKINDKNKAPAYYG